MDLDSVSSLKIPGDVADIPLQEFPCIGMVSANPLRPIDEITPVTIMHHVVFRKISMDDSLPICQPDIPEDVVKNFFGAFEYAPVQGCPGNKLHHHGMAVDIHRERNADHGV
jgi:hypothetical protein